MRNFGLSGLSTLSRGRLITCISVLILSATTAMSQVYYGSLTGTVTDPRLACVRERVRTGMSARRGWAMHR